VYRDPDICDDDITVDLRVINCKGVVSMGSEYGPMAGCYEYGNEQSGSIKMRGIS
jgi:hypothetical protein